MRRALSAPCVCANDHEGATILARRRPRSRPSRSVAVALELRRPEALHAPRGRRRARLRRRPARAASCRGARRRPAPRPSARRSRRQARRRSNRRLVAAVRRAAAAPLARRARRLVGTARGAAGSRRRSRTARGAGQLEQPDPALDVRRRRGREHAERRRAPCRAAAPSTEPREHRDQPGPAERPAEPEHRRRGSRRATSSGSGAAGIGLRDSGTASGEQTSHMPQSSVERLAEVLGDWPVPAAARVAEADEAVGALERLAARSGRAGRRSARPRPRAAAGSSTCIARPASKPRRTSPACSSMPTRTRGSGSSPSSSGVTSRPRRAARAGRGAEVVDASGRRSGRSVRSVACVGAAREAEAGRRRAVAAGPADHLDVALERLREVVERDEADVRLVDAHPERGRRDHDLHAPLDERLLRARPLVRLQPRVVVDRARRRGRGASARARSHFLRERA